MRARLRAKALLWNPGCLISTWEKRLILVPKSLGGKIKLRLPLKTLLVIKSTPITGILI